MVLPKLFSRPASSSSPVDKKNSGVATPVKTKAATNPTTTSPGLERPLPTRSGTTTRPSSPEKKPLTSAANAKVNNNNPTAALKPQNPTKDDSKGRKAAASPRSAPSRTGQQSQSQQQRKRSSAAAKHDPDSHPLNLPPEELRRLSRLSRQSANSQAMADEQNSMRSPTPSSPPPPPQQSNGAPNGADKDSAPAPPPHRTPTSPPPPAVDAEACKAAGNKFFKAREYEKAIQEYSKAVEADSKNATYRSNRAAAYMSAGKFVEALEDCKEADTLEPNNPKILLRYARIYTSLGRSQEALEVYDRINPPVSAKDRAPAEAMARHIKEADEQIREGSSGSLAIHALDQAEKALGVTVNPPRKWRLLRGEAYLKMGNVNALGDAQNVAMALLRSNSADPEALVLRGRALYAQGEDEKALQHFRQAISCDPDYKDAVKYLRMVQKLNKTKEDGNNKFKTGRYQEAVEIYTTALEIDPQNRGTNSKILQNRALCQTKLKNYKEAIADCERALQLDSSYTKARKTKAKALGESGDWEAAVKELKAIHEANPEEPGIAKEIRSAELELKKSKRKDYYKILGVEKDADDTQIKKAYRKLAIIHHPDKNQGDETAAERFKDIGEAYETLSDSQKRASYDSGEDLMDPADMFGGGMGGGMGGMGGMGGGMGGGISPEMLFNMMNGGGGGGGGGFGGFQSGGGGGHPFGGSGGRRQQGYPGGFPFG